MPQTVLVEQQRLEVLQPGNARRQDLDQVVAEHQGLQLAEGAHRLGHLADQVTAQGQHVQAAREIKGNFGVNYKVLKDLFNEKESYFYSI